MTNTVTDNIPTISSIESAYRRISSHIVNTPVLRSEELEKRTGATVLIKPETLQNSGSFKYRGAMNRVLQMSEEERKAGIVAWSSGNHALALSTVARQLGITVTILMPQEAPRTKINGVKANGGTVRLYDKAREVREEIGAQIAAETGAIIVPPYDDIDIITGQATVGYELSKQAAELGLPMDIALASCSGGGLVSGFAAAINQLSPQTSVYSVEPADFDDMARSLKSGKHEKNPLGITSICDALLVQTPGEITFDIAKATLEGGVSVTDDEVIDAIRFAYKYLKLVVEPGGAAPLAALLSGKLDIKGKIVGIVLTGGNIDEDKFIKYLAQ